MNLENSLNLARSSDKRDAALPATATDIGQGPARRVGVVVLGMHRSGTSAMTRMLSLLGCALPSTLMSAGDYNPMGHWESQRVADFNDEILTLAGTRWNDWLPVNERLSETLVWPQLVAKGREVLRQEFADAPLFVLKDPRICKLASFWMEVLAAEGVEPAFVLPIRNPIEVAQSLATRDAIDQSHGLLFWLRYALAAESVTRGRRRVFTEFGALLAGPEAMVNRLSEGLGVVWPRVSALSEVEISEFLTPELRHHVRDMAELGENPAISPWIRQAFEVMRNWARHGEAASDYPVLDSIAHAFDIAALAFARPMLNGELSAQRAAQLETDNTALIGERDEVAQRLGEVEAELTRMVGSQSDLVEERETTARRLDEVEAQFEQARAERDAQFAERDNLFGQLTALTEERTRLGQRLDEVETALHQAGAERDARTAERDELVRQQAVLAEEQHRSYALGLELEALQNRLTDQESALRQKQEEAAQAWAELAAERAARAALSEHNDQLEQQAEALAQSLQDSEGWVFRLAGERRQADLHAERLEREVRQLEHALARAQAAGRITENHPLQTEALKAALERQLAERTAECVDLSKRVRESEGALEAEKAELTQVKARLDDRFGEIAKLTRIYREQELQTDKQREQAEWLRQVYAITAGSPRWWVFMPRSWRNPRELRRLQRKGLFDGRAYLARYPDVAAEAMDPLRHYILHGLKEGRERF